MNKTSYIRCAVSTLLKFQVYEQCCMDMGVFVFHVSNIMCLYIYVHTYIYMYENFKND
jgi:hypothetical protein